MKGIDVSKHNGSIDFKKVYNAGYRFVMVRMGFGHAETDPKAVQNINNALAAGFAVGAYWFLYARNVLEARREAQAFLSRLAPYKGKLTFPVAADFEYDSDRFIRQDTGKSLSRAERTSIVKAFCEELEKAGWYTMVYANPDYIKNYFDWGQLKKYDLWLAEWTGRASYDYGIWQTGKAAVPGAVNRVDVNETLKPYPELIIESGLNGFSKKSENKEPSVKNPKPPDKKPERYLLCYINDGDLASAQALLNAMPSSFDTVLKHGHPEEGETRTVIQVGGAPVKGADLKITGRDRAEVLINAADLIEKLRG